MLDAENGIAPEMNDLVALTADIVSTYVTNNNVAAADLTGLIRDVHEALEKAANAQASPQPPPLVPAVPVRSSVTPEYIFCLEDGQPFKFLTRHLKTKYNLTPQEYRRKWNLPATYPMVAPNYSVKRAEMAKESKLGHRRA
ncbi:MucR family transcriptional regulator [Roseibium sp. Sym1]|uniref:MucR family transcriptional regulator n=1 Tax=Roseibium sp. Sym1 TaxID=3016006 RepID=UPI0022B40496|nr:MucR family transcriptional regulator [Roseibium sp. Sym1]